MTITTSRSEAAKLCSVHALNCLHLKHKYVFFVITKKKVKEKLILIKFLLKSRRNQRIVSKAAKDQLNSVISVVGSGGNSIRNSIHLPLISLMYIKIKLR